MTDMPERYGRRNVPKMIREWDDHRKACRAEGTPLIQSTLDAMEEHIDFAYRATPPALAVPEVAAQTFALLKIKSLHERTDNIHRGKEWQATARAIDDALAALRGEGRG